MGGRAFLFLAFKMRYYEIFVDSSKVIRSLFFYLLVPCRDVVHLTSNAGCIILDTQVKIKYSWLSKSEKRMECALFFIGRAVWRKIFICYCGGKFLSISGKPVFRYFTSVWMSGG